MNKSPPIQESSYYIHQRYEDTAQLIFQQQQKKKKDSSHGKHEHPDGASNEVEFAHYGNPGVIARKEAAARLASYKKEGKSPGKKEEKSKKKEEKGSKKEDKSSRRKDSASDRLASSGKDVFSEKYTPIDSPRLAYVGRSKELSPRSLKKSSLTSENDAHLYSPNDLRQYTFPVSPSSTNYTSASETSSPRETTFGTDGSVVQSPTDTSFDSDHEHVSDSPNEKQLNLDEETPTDLEAEDSFVEFGHYGNTGVIAKKEAVARVASILRKDRDTTKSTICSVM